MGVPDRAKWTIPAPERAKNLPRKRLSKSIMPTPLRKLLSLFYTSVRLTYSMAEQSQQKAKDKSEKNALPLPTLPMIANKRKGKPQVERTTSRECQRANQSPQSSDFAKAALQGQETTGNATKPQRPDKKRMGYCNRRKMCYTAPQFEISVRWCDCRTDRIRVRLQFISRRKTDWLTSRSKRLCRVEMTFGSESDALPEGERLRIGNGKSSAYHLNGSAALWSV
jgi:hypothetical protein